MNQLPYKTEIRAGRLRLELPVYARVFYRRGWIWKKVHDGSAWYADGLLPESERIELSFPIDAEVRIVAEGQRWQVALPVNPDPRTWKQKFQAVQKEAKVLFGSIGIHIALFAIALLGVTISATRLSETTSETETVAAAVEIPPEGAASAPSAMRPFEGLSYTRFFRNLIMKTGTAAERLNAMLGGGPSVADLSQVKVSGPTSATGVIATGSGPATGQMNFIKARKFTAFKDPSLQGKNLDSLSDKDALEVKNKFREIQSDLKRVYSLALAQDPSLSVRVAFETEVQKTGFLTVKSFKAQGKYTEAGLAELRRAMTDIFSRVQVGAGLAGLVVRGENVFIR